MSRAILGGAVDTDEETLVSAVLVASRVLVAVAARSLAAAPADITLAQYRVLVVLASRGPQFPTALAGELRSSPSSITRLCDRLEAKGLLTRASAPDNRKQVVLAISAAGKRVVDAVTRVRRAEIAGLVAAVVPGRRGAVVAALNDLAAAAGEVPDHSWSPSWAIGWEA
ncbi:MAG TPA: MarR family transcriptional regulator [Actinomycetota bacterium]|nr:MarR family transcriptional regulator [Actinomycetota bacterium]